MTDVKRTSGESGDKNRANCPSCGYYAGTHPVCVRCGARIDRRMSIKFLRAIALWGSIAGLIVLWYFAHRKQPEPVLISQITEVMNNAFVVIEGEVADIRMDEEKNTLRLTVKDETGQMKINAFNRLDRFREALGPDMPSLKDRIKVTGSLSISQAWGITMFLTVPDRIKIAKKYIVRKKNLGEIAAEDDREIYAVEAEVIDYEEFSTKKGFVLHKFLLADGTGELPMVLYSSAMDFLPPDKAASLQEVYSRIRMRACVSLYRGNVQLTPCDISIPSDLEIVSAASQRNADYKKVSLMTLKNIESGNTYMISEPVSGVSLGTEGIYLDMKNSKYDIFVRYARWDRLAGKKILEDGYGILSAPVIAEKTGTGINFRFADFSKIRIKESGKPEKNIQEENVLPPGEEHAALTEELPDLSGIAMIELSVLGHEYLGKYFLLEATVKNMDLGLEGVYLDLDGTDIQLFMDYSAEEKIGDFSMLNESGTVVSGPFKLISNAEGLQIRVVDPGSVKIKTR